MKLLIDGREAFPEIIRRIRGAQKSISVNMFIWRDDEIGNLIASELFYAARRGVKIDITKDRYGIVCECCEENRASFFHEAPTLMEQIKISVLTFIYNRDLLFRKAKGQESGFAAKLRQHPNIRLSADTNRYDHSKYFIFDDEILIMGGINIEDKENGKDRLGREYHDYMVEFEGAEYVEAFRAKLSGAAGSACGADGKAGLFAVNIKSPKRNFELKKRYLDIIDGAKSSLTILMAYFSPEPAFVNAIAAAVSRGVDVRIVIPKSANLADATNKRAMEIIKAACPESGRGSLRIYLSDYMLHAKLVMSENEIGLGSCNINKKAFRQLDEANCFVKNDAAAFAESVRKDVEKTVAAGTLADGKLSYSRALALAESVLM